MFLPDMAWCGGTETLTAAMTRSNFGMLHLCASRCCRPGRWLWM